jgi:hypothetical protein
LTELLAVNSIAQAIRGERVKLSADGWSLGVHADRLQEFLQAHADRPESGMFMTLDNAQFTLDGRTYPLGGVAYYAPSVRLTNEAELASHSGTDEPVAHYVAADGIYLLPIPYEG